MDHVKLERALVELARILPERPFWSAIIRADGKFLRQYPTHLDGDHIAALTYAHTAHTARILQQLSTGSFQFSVSCGEQGVYFIFEVNSAKQGYMLGLWYREHVPIDPIVQATRDHLDVLVNQLD